MRTDRQWVKKAFGTVPAKPQRPADPATPIQSSDEEEGETMHARPSAQSQHVDDAIPPPIHSVVPTVDEAISPATPRVQREDASSSEETSPKRGWRGPLPNRPLRSEEENLEVRKSPSGQVLAITTKTHKVFGPPTETSLCQQHSTSPEEKDIHNYLSSRTPLIETQNCMSEPSDLSLCWDCYFLGRSQ